MVPEHRDIQEALVKVGDKEQSFVDSKEWIGSFEVSTVLNQLLGVSESKLSLYIRMYSDIIMDVYCREAVLFRGKIYWHLEESVQLAVCIMRGFIVT